MRAENRDIYGWAITVGILSIFMGVILTVTWDAIYDEVKAIEESLLGAVPELTSGGIQIVAMFGLGLFLVWAILVMLDWRKRYQGMLLLLASGIVLFVLAIFDRFLPQMIGHPVQNVLAFLVGAVIGVITESARLPYRRTPGDLFYLNWSESSLRPLRIVTTNEQEAEFPVAVGGVYLLIMAIVAGANGALILAGASRGMLVISVVVSGVYAFALYRLFKTDVTRADFDVEILGPTASGKTLFFYGLWETVRNSDRYEPQGSNDQWRNIVKDIETNSDDWPAESTKLYHRLEFEFLYGKLNRSVEMMLNDYPGKDLGKIRDAVVGLRTDGGFDERKQSSLQTDGGTKSGADSSTPDWASGEESEPGPSGGDGSEQELQSKDETGGESDEKADSEQQFEVDVLAKYIQKTDIILVIIDTRKIIEAGFVGLDPDDFKGQVGEKEDYEPPEINSIDDICREVEPREVIAIATKSDLLIDRYTSDENENKPHRGSGDFEKFTEYVDDFFSEYTTFSDFKLSHDINTIYPVYFPTEVEKDKEPVPIKKDGKLQPEGFEQVLDEIVRP